MPFSHSQKCYKTIMRRLLADHDREVSATLHNVADTILMVAKDWLKQSPEQIAALKRLKAKLPKLAPGLTEKNRNLLASFETTGNCSAASSNCRTNSGKAISDKLPRNQRLVRPRWRF